MKDLLKTLAVLFILFSFSGNNNLQAQPVVGGDRFHNDSSIIVGEEVDLFTPTVNVSMGSSFSTFGAGSSAVGTYIAPEVSVPVTNKLSMSVGMGYSMMFMNAPGEFGGQTNTSYGSLFVSGTYQVNEKLTIRGTAYKTFMLTPPAATKPLNPSYFDFGSQGVKFDAEYKVSDKFRIGVSVEYQEQDYPSLFPNNNTNFGGSPFNTNSFTPNF